MNEVNHTDLILALCLGVQEVADHYQLKWVYLFSRMAAVPSVEESVWKSDTKIR